MGYGAYLKVRNDSTLTVSLYVADTENMFDYNQQGSNLISWFDNKSVEPEHSLPDESDSYGKYIETAYNAVSNRNEAKFTLRIINKQDGENIAEIKFQVNANDWTYKLTNPKVNISINNTDKQAKILITLLKDKTHIQNIASTTDSNTVFK